MRYLFTTHYSDAAANVNIETAPHTVKLRVAPLNFPLAF